MVPVSDTPDTVGLERGSVAPYTLMPHAILDDLTRTSTELLVYWALLRADDEGGRPLTRTPLPVLARCTPEAVEGALCALRAAGWIAMTPEPGEVAP